MQRNNYDDIINLPHHQSKTRPHMSMHDRAAQFSPFRAVSGHEDAVGEAARLTERRVKLDEDELAALDRKLRRLQAHLAEQPLVEITWFVPDKLKEGGTYRTITGRAVKLDTQRRVLELMGGNRIILDDILSFKVHNIPHK